MTRRGRVSVLLCALALAALLGAGLLRSPAAAQRPICAFTGYNDVAPVAAFSVSPQPAEVGRPVAFDGSFSRRPDGGRIERWAWDLDGDGRHETVQGLPTVSHVYAAPGRITVRLIVADACGRISSVASRVVDVVPDTSGTFR